ncbi:MAG: hypothetical protein U0871_17410 [Gemmataceae bacterium]
MPLLVRWPGHVPPGSVRDDLTCFLDPAELAWLASRSRPGCRVG